VYPRMAKAISERAEPVKTPEGTANDWPTPEAKSKRIPKSPKNVKARWLAVV
jgi:hypothetical protein